MNINSPSKSILASNLSSFDFQLLDMIATFAGQAFEENDKDLFALLFLTHSQGSTLIELEDSAIQTELQNIFESLSIEDKDSIENIDTLFTKIKVTIQKIKDEKLSSIVGHSQSQNHPFILEDNQLFIQKYFIAKNTLTQKIQSLFQKENPFDLKAELHNDTKSNLSFLHENQREAVYRSLYQNLIITGGPGTGKTTVAFYILKEILERDIHTQIYLAAPSGKAADRMRESIKNSLYKSLKEQPESISKEIQERFENLSSSTIHRLLKYQVKTHSFKYNSQNPFPEDCVFIIDEASMIDIVLFSNLLEAIPPNSKVFLLGDENQLPSVNAGAVLGDLLSELLTHSIVRLTKSYRFAGEIAIIANAVNNASPKNEASQKNLKLLQEISWKAPLEIQNLNFSTLSKNSILFFETPQESQWKIFLDDWIDKHYRVYFPKVKDLKDRLLFHTQNTIIKDDTPIYGLCEEVWEWVSDSKILCAEKNNFEGTLFINEYIEQKLKNHGVSLIIISKNLYHHHLYNGDLGIHFKLGTKEVFMFRQANTFVIYPASPFSKDQYETAFAITIHKSQGSEFRTVMLVLPSHSKHLLLTKQILYTGITRAINTCILVSKKESFMHAAQNKNSRKTGLIKTEIQ